MCVLLKLGVEFGCWWKQADSGKQRPESLQPEAMGMLRSHRQPGPRREVQLGHHFDNCILSRGGEAGAFERHLGQNPKRSMNVHR